ncbi:CAP domain-containing protein [Halobacillus mangrovi]|uniref:CAP domain-containing protein n=1 Tax=Halobacillus mangrovi TaxID=402384 RepID=UPI003D98938D
MKKLAAVFFLIFLVLISWRLFFDNPSEPTSIEPPVEETFATEEPEKVKETKSIFDWKGASSNELESDWGEPDRKDPSGYGYVWWIYDDELSQMAIKDNKVVSVVSFSSEQREKPVYIGQSYQEISTSYKLPQSLRIEQVGNYTFELTEQDLKERPLLPLDKNWTAQLYFDVVTEKLSAIRLVRNDILLKLQPYKVIYRGQLPMRENLDRSDWKRIETGMEQQILTMTNYLRIRHGENRLMEHKEAAAVAFLHSKDMNDHNYFSHYSPDGRGLKERLGDISYVEAGENIAAQYIDATAAVHGWLNSQNHREALLDKSYTHIGIGVHQRYYTQNFLSIP